MHHELAHVLSHPLTELTQSIFIFYSMIGVLLILLSAFFSCAETGLMALNRYRLRHSASMNKRSALFISKLLDRPDRLLGMLLIGNNVTNIFASALFSIIAMHVFGEKGVFISSTVLAFIILIFAEVAPKTFAAFYPDEVSRYVVWPLIILMKLFYPIIWLINFISNNVLRLLRINISHRKIEPLNRDELRSIVHEGTGNVLLYQRMLLGVLDLTEVTVDYVMVPRLRISGIDLAWEWEVIQEHIINSEYDWLPVYHENINHIAGILHVRKLMHAACKQTFNREMLMKALREPYFIPEGALLNVQLEHFQRHQQRMALVVDEYGEIQGLLTLKDILEEIVGEFTSNSRENRSFIRRQTDGSYLVDGAVTLRELNRTTGWHFRMDGSRTVNGLILDYLQTIPQANVGMRIQGYPIEIMDVKRNRIKIARIFPA